MGSTSFATSYAPGTRDPVTEEAWSLPSQPSTTKPDNSTSALNSVPHKETNCPRGGRSEVVAGEGTSGTLDSNAPSPVPRKRGRRCQAHQVAFSPRGADKAGVLPGRERKSSASRVLSWVELPSQCPTTRTLGIFFLSVLVRSPWLGYQEPGGKDGGQSPPGQSLQHGVFQPHPAGRAPSDLSDTPRVQASEHAGRLLTSSPALALLIPS